MRTALGTGTAVPPTHPVTSTAPPAPCRAGRRIRTGSCGEVGRKGRGTAGETGEAGEGSGSDGDDAAGVVVGRAADGHGQRGHGVCSIVISIVVVVVVVIGGRDLSQAGLAIAVGGGKIVGGTGRSGGGPHCVILDDAPHPLRSPPCHLLSHREADDALRISAFAKVSEDVPGRVAVRAFAVVAVGDVSPDAFGGGALGGDGARAVGVAVVVVVGALARVEQEGEVPLHGRGVVADVPAGTSAVGTLHGYGVFDALDHDRGD